MRAWPIRYIEEAEARGKLFPDVEHVDQQVSAALLAGVDVAVLGDAYSNNLKVNTRQSISPATPLPLYYHPYDACGINQPFETMHD